MTRSVCVCDVYITLVTRNMCVMCTSRYDPVACVLCVYHAYDMCCIEEDEVSLCVGHESRLQ